MADPSSTPSSAERSPRAGKPRRRGGAGADEPPRRGGPRAEGPRRRGRPRTELPHALPCVRELPLGARPRERLRQFGARVLSLRELLALVIGSGGSDSPVLTLADRLLASCGGRLRALATATPAEIEATPGIGEATSARILAALELGRRAAEESVPDRPRVRGPADVFRLMGPRLRDLPHEEFHALLLNTQHRVLRDVTVTRGILDASLIHPREVFRPAIVENAAAVILVHNHPSGDPTPSPEDRAVTRQMRDAGRAIGIRVLDHVIVGGSGWATAGVGEGGGGP